MFVILIPLHLFFWNSFFFSFFFLYLVLNKKVYALYFEWIGKKTIHIKSLTTLSPWPICLVFFTSLIPVWHLCKNKLRLFQFLMSFDFDDRQILVWIPCSCNETFSANPRYKQSNVCSCISLSLYGCMMFQFFLSKFLGDFVHAHVCITDLFFSLNSQKKKKKKSLLFFYTS